MENAEVRAWAKQHSTPDNNLMDHAAIFRYFAEQIEPAILAAGKTPAWWNDRYDTMTDRPDHAVRSVMSHSVVCVHVW